MKAKDMEEIAHHGNHQVAPKAWRDVPNCTGDYDCDASIQHGNNSDMPTRLNLYVKRGENAYGPLTGYSGYKNYHGDT